MFTDLNIDMTTDLTDEEIKSILDQRKVAIYVRESTKRQVDEGYNIQAQEELCIEYVEHVLKRNDYCVYREKGYSAKTINRPVMKDLIKDIESGKIGTVVVQRVDRLFRSVKGMAELTEILNEEKVRLITIRESIDTSSVYCRMVLSMFTIMAEMEEEQIMERTIQAQTYAAEQGSYIKGGEAPFGTMKERVYFDTGGHIIKLHPNPWSWPILKKIYEMAYEGYNCKEISLVVSDLQEMKKHNKKLGDDQIGRILSNKIYMGVMTLQGKEYKIDFEGCLDAKYWEQVQVNRSVNLKSSLSNEYLYHGKIRCECGTPCIVDVTNKKLANGTIKKYRYYVCPHCGKRISEVYIFDHAEYLLKANFEMTKNESYRIIQEKKIERLKVLEDEMRKLYVNGEIGAKAFINELKKNKETCQNIHKRIKRKHLSYDSLGYEERKNWLDDHVKFMNVDFTTKQISIEYN